MIRHIVWWTLKEEADHRTLAENIRHIRQASAMLHGLPSIISVEVSAKVQPSTTVPAQLVLMSTHKTMEDLEDYKQDPVHLDFAKLVTAVSTSRNAIDYSLEDED